MKTLAAVAFVAGLVGGPVVNPVTGSYTCRGTSGPDTYAANLTIAAVDDTYEFVWSSPERAGGIVSQGLGLPHGDVIAVAIISVSGHVGVALYAVSPGRLEGFWTRGDGKLDREMCQQGRPA